MQEDGQIEEAISASEASERRPELSVVVPMFNEEQNVGEFYRRLTEALDAYGKSYEMVFVEDGSTDNTFSLLEALHKEDPRVRVIRFIRNFGQQMALWAGLRHVRGDAIVLIDADLQRLPEEIPILVDKLAEGYDIVYGIRTKRSESLVRKLGSWGMSSILYRVLGIDLPDSMSGFTALDHRFVERLNLYNAKNKFFSGLFAYLSYGRWSAVKLSHSPRHAGVSKYSIPKLVGLTLHFVTTFTTTPLRFSFYAGVALMLLSVFGLAGWIVAGLLAFEAVPHIGMAVILAAFALISGVQLVSLGILGEYIGSIYHEVKDQPAYVVEKILER